jgi:hypothetical protein
MTQKSNLNAITSNLSIAIFATAIAIKKASIVNSVIGIFDIILGVLLNLIITAFGLIIA